VDNEMREVVVLALGTLSSGAQVFECGFDVGLVFAYEVDRFSDARELGAEPFAGQAEGAEGKGAGRMPAFRSSRRASSSRGARVCSAETTRPSQKRTASSAFRTAARAAFSSFA